MNSVLAKATLVVLLSLNLKDEAYTLREQIMTNELAITEDVRYDNKLIIVNNNVPMWEDLGCSEQVCTLEKGVLLYYSEGNEAYYAVHNNDLKGFVEKKYCITEGIEEEAEKLGLDKVATATNNVHTYSEPNYQGEQLKSMKAGTEFKLAESKDDFSYVEFQGDKFWVDNRYLDFDYDFTDILVEEDDSDFEECLVAGRYSGKIGESLVNSFNAAHTEITDYALSFVGNKYVWGGNSLENGVDCSGFVQQIYKSFGYSLPRNSRYQAQYCLKISEAELQPGDLVFYGNSSGINHVAMYVGDGCIVHASNSKPYPAGGIKVSKMKYREPAMYGRVR